MKLPIKDVKIRKIGGSFYFLIPKQYIVNKIIDIKKKYDSLIFYKDKDMELLMKGVKITKSGHGFYFLIPKEYIKNKALNIKKKYDLLIVKEKK